MLRAEWRPALVMLVVLAVVAGGVWWGGPRVLYATGLWVDGGNSTIDPTLYAATPTPTPTPVTPAPAAGTATGTAPNPQTLLTKLQAVPRPGVGTAAMSVVDTAGTLITGESADRALIPASSLKLLTSAAALAAYGPDHRFTTKVVQGAGNQIVLVGGGDPYLRGAGTQTYPARASIVDLAEATATALKAKGVTAVTFGYDDTLFTGPGWNPAWLPGYKEFATPTSALWIDEGIVGGVHRDTPSQDAAAAFAAQLAARGITVSGTASSVAPAGAATVASVQSLPLDLIVSELLLHSDNDATEVLFRHVALAAGRPGSIADAQIAVPAKLVEIGLWRDGTVMQDGSGLSRGDRASATALAEAVAKGFSDDRYRALVTGLPTAAADGTLYARFDDPTTEGAGRGMVRAKTGTLTGVHTLAGFTKTADGATVVFAFMANDVVPNGDLAARDWLERVSTVVAACGCP